MTMTKQQVRGFRNRIKLGVRPPLPVWAFNYLGRSANDIKAEVDRAIAFHYGNGLHAHRLVQMGLLDNDYNTTVLGWEYINMKVKKTQGVIK